MDELFLIPQPAQTAPPFAIATIGTVSVAGCTLILEGQNTATAKSYRRLSSYAPTAGDRVLCARLSGSLVILGKITE